MTKPFLSICMIVKNEEKMLLQNLPSIAEVAEELIIVDTGSTDNTKKVATCWTEHVYDFQWIKDFAAARNFAASKATGEWILALDADERIDPDNFRDSIEKLRENANRYSAYLVNITNFSDRGYGGHNMVNRMVRIYRNTDSIKYERALHEQLVKFENGQKVELRFGEIPLQIYHYGYLSRVFNEKRKLARNIEILEQGNDIDKETGYYFFNKAQHFWIELNYEEALENLIEAHKRIESNKLEDWSVNCIGMIVTCLMKLRRYHEALIIISDAEEIFEKVPDFPISRGIIYYEQGRFEDAKEICHSILSNVEKYTAAVNISGSKDVVPHELLGDMYEAEKDYQNAITHYVNGINISYSYILLRKIVMLLLKVHTEKEVFTFVKNNELIKLEAFGIALMQQLLNEGYGELAELLTDLVTIHSEDIRLSIKTKRRIIELDSQVKQLTDIVTEEELQRAIKLNFIDIGDLCFLYFMTSDESIRLLFDEINASSVFTSIFLKKQVVIEENVYLAILEKAIQLGKGSFVDFLLKQDNNNTNLFPEIADVFFKYGYKEIALDFYQEVDEKNVTKQGYENIIEFLVENNELEEANRIAQLAIDLFEDNFVFYKHVIENTEDNRDFIDQASAKYEGGNWLKQQSFLADFF